MTARTHDMFAVAFLTTAFVVSPPGSISASTLFASLVGNVVGGLIPDIDQASNRLWDLLPAGNFLGKIFRHLFLSHRTISHSLLGGFLLFKALEAVLPKIFNAQYVNTDILLVAIILGFVSHLFADSLTKEGIPLFFPFSIKVGVPPLRFLRVGTDTWVEHLFVLPIVISYVVYLFVNHKNLFIDLLRNVAA